MEDSNKLKKKSFSFSLSDGVLTAICPTHYTLKLTKEGKIKDHRDLWGGGYGTQRKKQQAMMNNKPQSSPIQKPQQNNMNQSSGGY